MSIAQTSSMYSYALHSGLTVAILLSPPLYFPFTHILSHFIVNHSAQMSLKCRSSPFTASYSGFGFDGYISLIVRAGLATILARCQYFGKRKIDSLHCDRKRTGGFWFGLVFPQHMSQLGTNR